jgi:CRP-like cAMP-binding protein
MLNEGLFHLLFKEIQYCFFNRSDVIFHYGQPGDIYYIILKGSVAILTPRIDNLTYDEVSSIKIIVGSHIFRSQLATV